MTLSDIPIAAWLALAAAAMIAGFAYWKKQRAKTPVLAPAEIDASRRAVLGAAPAVQRPQASASVEWKPARDAVEAYADPELLRARDVWSQRHKTASERMAAAERRIAEIRNAFQGGEVPKETEARTELEKAEREQRQASMVSMNTAEETRQLRLDIHADVYKKLCLGTLIAKGMREPQAAGSSEARIPATEWRLLMLHHLDAKAVQKGVEGKVMYSGLVIGKPV